MYTSNLYRKSPRWMQELLLSSRSWMRSRVREGQALELQLAEVMQTQFLDTEQLAALQLERTRQTLLHAGQEVLYWRELFARLKFDPRDMTQLSDLQALPVLDKDTLKAQGLRMRSSKPKGPSFASTSSGTTGSFLTGWRDLHAIVRENAFVWRQMQWAGVKLGDHRAWLRGDKIVPSSQQHAPFWRVNAADRLLMLSAYHLSQARAGAYVEAIERYDPVCIQAYPSAIVFLAQCLEAEGRRYGGAQLRSIVTSSETLLGSHRVLLERVFGCSVFDWYGAFERVAAIGSCEHGHYHLLTDYSFVELRHGALGSELLGTSFDNRLMPLIRYQMNDHIELDASGQACTCGRAFPRVKKILGRAQERLLGLHGQQVFMPANVFDDLPGLLAGQWLQHEPGRVTLQCQFALGQALQTEAIEAVARRYIGPLMQLEIRLVDHLPRSAAGKLPAVVQAG
jgi:phenylacetate-CoA ligase